MTPRAIEVAAILPLSEYLKVRAERRRQITEIKKNRRLEVGPFATFYFESYETMLHQVHEMLFIEKGGPGQIPGELEAYNPLVPKGDELVATIMIEIEDPVRRKRVLAGLGGIEGTATVSFAGEVIKGEPETDQERTTTEGKASSVQFVHFRFAPAQIAKFRTAGTQVVLGLAHANYGHMAVMPESMRAELAKDFD